VSKASQAGGLRIAVSVAASVLLATAAAAAQAIDGNWIWHAEPTARKGVSAPAGKRWFRYHLLVPAGRAVKSATCTMTADNEFILFVNGTKVGSGNDWTKPCSFDVSKHLAAGENVIAVQAENWKAGGANPAGLIGSLRVQFATGKPLVVHTDGRWRSTSAQADGVEPAARPDDR
jgi:hypothetical protein